MLRIAYALLLGLFGAGIIHIVMLFLLPGFSDRDAWSRLAAVAGPYRMVAPDLIAGEPPLLGAADPLFKAAACRFDLAEGMVQVRSTGRVPFWSASIYDRAGRNVYSFNDRALASGALNFVLLTKPQMVEIREQLPESMREALFVETTIDEGILVVRAFAPDESWTPAASAFVDAALCELR